MKSKLDSPRVVCIIPARGGSKGLPKKNIRILRGRPLVAWPVRAAQLSGAVDDVLVSTDDEDIAAEAREAGADGVMLEVHPDPENSAVDPLQAIDFDAFEALMGDMEGVAAAVGRTLGR